MIIDEILERRDYEEIDGDFGYYGQDQFRSIYDYARDLEDDYLLRAIDNGSEKEIADALCRYVNEYGYDPSIEQYIRSVKWIPKGMK